MQSAALLAAGLVCLAIHFWCVGRCATLDFATGRRDGLDLKTDCASNRGFYPRWSVPGLIAALAGVVLLIAAVLSPSHARDLAGRYASSPKPWFDQLKSKSGELCCSDADGTAISDADWKSKDGRFQIFIEGEWRDVPDSAVITESNRAGKTMVWPLRGYMGLTIRCFMPGVMG